MTGVQTCALPIFFNHPVHLRGVIKEIVLEYGEAVLKGDIGVDEAVSAILQKCNLYLAE